MTADLIATLVISFKMLTEDLQQLTKNDQELTKRVDALTRRVDMLTKGLTMTMEDAMAKAKKGGPLDG